MDIYIVQVERGHDSGEDDVTPFVDKAKAMRKVNDLIDTWCRHCKVDKKDIDVGLDAWHIESDLFEVTIRFKNFIV